MAKGKYEQWLTEDGLLKLESWARDGLTDEQIAKNMNIAISTLYEWKKVYSEISESMSRGKEIVDIEVENALLKRALGYTYDEITKERIIDSGQKKRHAEGEIKLTENQWQFALDYFNNECCYCGAKGDLAKDHIIPLNSGGKFVSENIIPCCGVCNSSKHDSDMKEWYKKQKFYDEYKLRKIYEYIKLAHKQNNYETSDELVITKIVTKQVIPDTTAQKFWLRNRQPDKWRDKIIDNQSNNDGVLKEMLEGLKNDL